MRRSSLNSRTNASASRSSIRTRQAALAHDHENAMPGSTLGTLLDGGPRLSVGIITADLLNLGAALRLLEAGGAQAIHLDVGDGVFSPLFTLGPPVVKAVPAIPASLA